MKPLWTHVESRNDRRGTTKGTTKSWQNFVWANVHEWP